MTKQSGWRFSFLSFWILFQNLDCKMMKKRTKSDIWNCLDLIETADAWGGVRAAEPLPDIVSGREKYFPRIYLIKNLFWRFCAEFMSGNEAEWRNPETPGGTKLLGFLLFPAVLRRHAQRSVDTPRIFACTPWFCLLFGFPSVGTLWICLILIQKNLSASKVFCVKMSEKLPHIRAFKNHSIST